MNTQDQKMLKINGTIYIVVEEDTPDSYQAKGLLNLAAAMRKAGQSHSYFLRRPKGRKAFIATRWNSGTVSSATSLGYYLKDGKGAMRMIIFLVNLPNGAQVLGPIHGNCGLLGAGSNSPEVATEMLHTVLALQCRARAGKPQNRCWEPEPGCLAVRSTDFDRGNDSIISVPLTSSEFVNAFVWNG